MAATNNPEISATELELKRRGRRRLIGAITIGLLAIVFLPMIFDREPKRSGQAIKTQDISVQVPSKEGQPALPAPSAAPVVGSTSLPAIPSTSRTAPADVSRAAALPDSKAAIVPAVPPVAEGVRETIKPAVKVEKPTKTETATNADKSGFVVQLGVFGDADNAKLAIAKMKEAKLAVYTESIPIKTGNATRVRVGPFATRDRADAALAQVKLAGADGKVIPLK